MAQDHTKEQYLQKVEWQENYCILLENAISEIKTKLETKDCTDPAMLKLREVELTEKLRMQLEDAKDSRHQYEDIFIPQYEKRMEECFTNFDEYYEYIKNNLHRIPQSTIFEGIINSYPIENPDNKDEGTMLILYEKIKPFVLELRKQDKNPKGNLKVVKDH